MKFKILPLILVSMFLSACSEPVEPDVAPSIPAPIVDETVEEVPPPITEEASRNSERKADLQTIAVALEFYKVDTGSYPTVGGCLVDASELTEKLSVYVKELPTGVAGVNTLCEDQYFYHAYGDGKAYVLVAELEDPKGFETRMDHIYSNIPDAAFFTESYSVADLETKLAEYTYKEGENSKLFYILTHD